MEGEGIIDTFVDKRYYISHYKELAKCVGEICKANLPSDVKALVTYRPKDKKRLRTKLKKINRARIEAGQPGFQDEEDILQKIHDLAGVRIALYVPSQKDEVIEGIKSWFKDVKITRQRRGLQNCQVCHGASGSTAATGSNALQSHNIEDLYAPVFAGYTADHARVKLFDVQAKSLHDWKEDQVTEIQVVSVLLHAWAEVEHDITYKSIKAEAGMEERQILDCLNGFIISSELLLNRLHSVHTNRVNVSRRPFTDKHDLARVMMPYLERYLSPIDKCNLDLRMLFELLKAVDLNTERKLRPLLEEFYARSVLPSEHVRPNSRSYFHGPFQLANYVQSAFAIMEHIVTNLSEEQEYEARMKAQHGIRPDTYRCRVIMSSFIWLAELAWDGMIGQVVKEYVTTDQTTTGEERKQLEWIFFGSARYDILKDRADAGPKDSETLRTLWNWFDRQEEHTYFHFAFKISQMGVFGSFDEDLRLFHKAEESDDED
jgi:ppGpp synthetase/RelA/SpoT-type nucleotidyltranferase